MQIQSLCCICFNNSSKQDEKTIDCSFCSSSFHLSCSLIVENSQFYKCQICEIISSNPQLKLIKVIQKPYQIQPSQGTIEQLCPFIIEAQIFTNIRLAKQSIGIFVLNGRKGLYQEFSFFLNNCPIKPQKMVDGLFQIEERLIMPNINYLQIQCECLLEPATIGIILFQKRRVDELQHLIMKIQDQYDDIKSYNNKIISLKDPITYEVIQIPVRGLHCEHYECFDLQIYLHLNFQQQIWKCPICLQKIMYYELIVDSKLMTLIKDQEQHCLSTKYVQISQDGRYQILNDDESQINNQIQEELKLDQIGDQTISDNLRSKLNQYFRFNLLQDKQPDRLYQYIELLQQSYIKLEIPQLINETNVKNILNILQSYDDKEENQQELEIIGSLSKFFEAICLQNQDLINQMVLSPLLFESIQDMLLEFKNELFKRSKMFPKIQYIIYKLIAFGYYNFIKNSPFLYENQMNSVHEFTGKLLSSFNVLCRFSQRQNYLIFSLIRQNVIELQQQNEESAQFLAFYFQCIDNPSDFLSFFYQNQSFFAKTEESSFQEENILIEQILKIIDKKDKQLPIKHLENLNQYKNINNYVN